MTQTTCKRCVMDSSAPNIHFNNEGHCNFCEDFISSYRKTQVTPKEKENLEKIVKSKSKKSRFDCIIGVSGGVDSSYTLLKAVQSGLKPLAVHMDNGWNTELAVHNIHNLVNTLGVELHTHIIQWEEYRDLMLAFFKAGVVDIELLYDHAMLAVNYSVAYKNGLNFILAGTNKSSEGMQMPDEWNWLKFDATNIRDIYRAHGSGRKLKSFPFMTTSQYLYYRAAKGIKWVSYLDHIDYNKSEALKELKDTVDYKPYPYKHYESVFTRFYQGYILPEKFAIDKRKLHFSNLICSGQMTRKDAIEALKESPYPSRTQLEEDFEYVLTKLKMSESEFRDYIKKPRVSHDCYKSDAKQFYFLMNARQKMLKFMHA